MNSCKHTFIEVINLKFRQLVKCVCVCMCVFIFFQLVVSSGCTTSVTYVRGSDQRSFAVSISWVLSAKFLHLNFRIYHISPPKTKTSAHNLLERKENDIMCLAFRKDDIFDIGYKTAIRNTVELRKDTKDKEATLI